MRSNESVERQRKLAASEPGLMFCPECEYAKPLEQFVGKRGLTLVKLCGDCREYQAERRSMERAALRGLKKAYLQQFAEAA